MAQAPKSSTLQRSANIMTSPLMSTPIQSGTRFGAPPLAKVYVPTPPVVLPSVSLEKKDDIIFGSFQSGSVKEVDFPEKVDVPPKNDVPFTLPSIAQIPSPPKTQYSAFKKMETVNDVTPQFPVFPSSTPLEVEGKTGSTPHLRELIDTLNVDAPVVTVAANRLLDQLSQSSSTSTSSSSSSSSTPPEIEKTIESTTLEAKKEDTTESKEGDEVTEDKEEEVNLVSDVPFVANPVIPSVFLLQDLRNMTLDQKHLYREQLISYYDILADIDTKEETKQYKIPSIDPSMSLDEVLTVYQNRMYIYVRRLTISRKKKKFQLYLGYGWGIMELVFLMNGYNMMHGYAQTQLKIIGCYDDILDDLAKVQYEKDEKKVVKHVEEEISPFMQLVKSSMWNTVIIVTFQYFSSFLSPADSKNMISGLVEGVFDEKGKLRVGANSALGGVVRGLLSAYVPEKYLSLYDTYVMPYFASSEGSKAGPAKISDVAVEMEEML